MSEHLHPDLQLPTSVVSYRPDVGEAHRTEHESGGVALLVITRLQADSWRDFGVSDLDSVYALEKAKKSCERILFQGSRDETFLLPLGRSVRYLAPEVEA